MPRVWEREKERKRRSYEALSKLLCQIRNRRDKGYVWSGHTQLHLAKVRLTCDFPKMHHPGRTITQTIPLSSCNNRRPPNLIRREEGRKQELEGKPLSLTLSLSLSLSLSLLLHWLNTDNSEWEKKILSWNPTFLYKKFILVAILGTSDLRRT